MLQGYLTSLLAKRSALVALFVNDSYVIMYYLFVCVLTIKRSTRAQTSWQMKANFACRCKYFDRLYLSLLFKRDHLSQSWSCIGAKLQTIIVFLLQLCFRFGANAILGPTCLGKTNQTIPAAAEPNSSFFFAAEPICICSKVYRLDRVTDRPCILYQQHFLLL